MEKPTQFRAANGLVAVLLASLAGPVAAAESKPTDGKVSYYKHVRPVFQAHCQGCHQPAKAKGDYVMTEFAALLKGGESGVAIEPGKPDASHLVELITAKDGKAEMPKGKEPLHAEEIALVRKWIEQGAADDTPASAKQRYTMENPPEYSKPPVITSLDFSPDGQLLAVTGFHEILLHKADGSELVARLVGLSERVESLKFSPDGKWLAASGGQPARMGEVQIWDVEKRALSMSVPVTYDTVFGVSWSPDSERVAFGCPDKTVRAIEAKTGKQVFFNGAHNDWVFDTVYSIKGDHLVSVGRDMATKLYDFATQRFIDNITSITPGALKGGIAAVDRHPLRDEVLVGGSDGVPKIYQMYRTTKREIGDDANLLQELPALTGRVFSVAFSKDAKKVAAGSSLDGTGEVHVYGINPDQKAPEEIKKILVKPTHTRSSEEINKMQKYFTDSVKVLAALKLSTPIYAVAFSPDGNTVAAAGGDGVIRLLDGNSGSTAKEFIPVKVPRHAPEDVAALEVQPSQIDLNRPHGYVQLLVTAKLRNGDSADVTREIRAEYDKAIVGLSQGGVLKSLQDGETKLAISYAGQTHEVPVKVTNAKATAAPDFVRDVNPVISKLGCNAGTCHGSKEGKAGFKLSLRGYDPIYDIRALTDDMGSRRVNVAAPDSSLMLLKPTGAAPHEGGQVLVPDSGYYQILRSWIANGAKVDLKSPKVSSIELSPKNPVVQKIGDQQQIRVIATYADGTKRDVSAEAFIESGNTEVAKADKTGLVTTLRRGEAPVLARYEGSYASTVVTVMGDRSGFVWEEPKRFNKIDEFVAAKLKRMKTLSSDVCTDLEFLRRIHLDLTGLPPSAEDVRKFAADTRDSQVKRMELIDKLIGGDPFIEHWTNKWADLLQVNRKFLNPEGASAFRAWIRNEVAKNTPYDQFAVKVITATGSNKDNPAASYFKILRTPEETMENTTHLFLAVRFNCNKCHDHPFERWTQDNYYSLAAFFGQIDRQKDPSGGDVMIGGTAVEGGKPLYEIVLDKKEGEVIHDRTKQVSKPSFPYLAKAETPKEATRRQALASWITSADNQYFAMSYVNRVWGYLTGTGVIEPLDDIRAGNPPSNPELLQWLTDQFIKSGFNTRELMRLICQSRTYQLSVASNQWNEDDATNFSHAKARRLPAEALYDAVYAVTGAQSKIPGVPPGTRAAQLPDVGVKLADGFLGNLGQPARESSCECERSSGLQLGPVMAMISGPTVNDAISAADNAIAKLAKEISDDTNLVQELFLRVLNRPPSEAEVKSALETVSAIDGEHRALVAELQAYEKEVAPKEKKREEERVARIEELRKQLAAYEAELKPRREQMERDKLAKTAKLEKELAEYEQSKLPANLAEWEKKQSNPTGWSPLNPSYISSTVGTLRLLSDGSILAGGEKNKGVTYTLAAETNLTGITGVKLEALTHESFPNNGPGRSADGNFILAEISATLGPKPDPAKWELTKAWEFSAETEGWTGLQQVELAVADSALKVVSKGNKRILVNNAVQAPKGAYVLELITKHDQPMLARVFWKTGANRFTKEQSKTATLVPGGLGSQAHRFYFQTDADLTGLRLDPGEGQGEIVIDAIRLYKGEASATAVALKNAKADFSQSNFEVAKAIDGDRKGMGWAIAPELGKNHVATFETAPPVGMAEGGVLTITLDHFANTVDQTLGRFRVWVTTEPAPHNFGLPAAVTSTLKTPLAQRAPEQTKALLAYYRDQDDEWKKRNKAIADSKQPLPPDAKLVEMQGALANAEKPLQIDSRLQQLRRDVELSAGQNQNRRLTGAQDLAWALINSPAFLFNY